MLEDLFNMNTAYDGDLPEKMLSMACLYGNVEVVEYLTQKLSITHVSDEEIPTILDFMKQPDSTPEVQQVFTMCKNAATIRYEYMLHKNPDTQKIRKTCPFEECKRLVAEKINAQKTISSGNKATDEANC